MCSNFSLSWLLLLVQLVTHACRSAKIDPVEENLQMMHDVDSESEEEEFVWL